MSPPRRPTPMRLLASEYCLYATTRGIRFPGSASASAVSGSPSRLFFAHRPPFLSKRVHPPKLPLPFRVLPLRARLTARVFGEAPSRGFLPSWRHQPEASTRLGIPRPRIRSVLGVSHALDGFLRSRPCGFVSPRCRLQGSLFRGFPLGEAVSSHRRPLPSCRWRRPAARWLPTALHVPPSRLQGLAPHRDPLRHKRCLIACAARSPPELRLLQVLSLLVVGAPSRPLRS